MRPIDVAEAEKERGLTSTSSTSSSATPSTSLLRNAALPLPPPLPRQTIPQSHEAAASLANFAQGLPVVVKV